MISTSSTCITDIKEDIYDVHYFTFTLTGAHQDHTLFINFSEDDFMLLLIIHIRNRMVKLMELLIKQQMASTSYIQLAQALTVTMVVTIKLLLFLGNSGRRRNVKGFCF